MAGPANKAMTHRRLTADVIVDVVMPSTLKGEEIDVALRRSVVVHRLDVQGRRLASRDGRLSLDLE
jgi:hypothetical protein